MAQKTSPTRIPCTYIGCNFAFKSVAEMRKHKTNFPHHDYCNKCDEDFEDEERLLLHKIKSDAHIVCPICNMDFKSEGGRDSHVRQIHRAEQNLVCHGCRAIFKSANGLMRHIEDNQCKEIPRIRLLREQSKKLMIKEALKGGQSDNLPILHDPMNLDDVDGGVKLNPVDLENREAMMNQPRLGEDDPTSDVSTFLSLKHWPRVGTRVRALVGGEEDFISFSPENRAMGKGKEIDMSTGQSVGIAGSNHDLFARDFIADAGQTLRMLNENWDATEFFNSFSGQYICPSCNAQFTKMQTFEEHVLSESTDGKTAECPGCFRHFKTTAALIAHCESTSTRCKINDSARFPQIIDEISGGIIQANGYENGMVKYEAGELSISKNTTIGRTMHRTQW